jgi:hypothetical protein
VDLMRRVREFTNPVDANSARQLTRQLAEFEENADAETRSIRLVTLARLTPKETTQAASGAVLAPGESLGVDTTAGNLEVTLEQPTAKSAGHLSALFKRVAANTITLRPSGGALINGASTLAVTSAGLRLILSDGENYWA